jgi:uncharacterized membrane protein YGL010W
MYVYHAMKSNIQYHTTVLKNVVNLPSAIFLISFEIKPNSSSTSVSVLLVAALLVMAFFSLLP